VPKNNSATRIVPKIRPFLRWAGGKQNLVHHLLKHAPEDDVVKKYYEPFLGAGSLFFANGFDNAFISDINPHLINAYKKIRADYRKIHKLIRLYEKKFLSNEEFYYKIRNQFNRDQKKLNYVQAARFVFLLHSNYNGMYRINKQGMYNVPVGKLEPCLPTLDDLKIISKKLKGKEIVAGSYDQILGKVKRGHFIYMDPPYPPLDWDSQAQQFTVDKFSKEDQKKLAAFARKLDKKGCFVLISNSDVPLIRELYKAKKWRKKKLKTTRWVSCKSERKQVAELLIKNY
jgi:DNA adenine methylase